MTPLPPTVNTRQIAYVWLFGVVPLVVIVNGILKEEITYGDLITIAISALVAIAMAVGWFRRQLIANRPIKVLFYNGFQTPRRGKPSRECRMVIEKCRPQTAYVRLLFRRGIQTEEMNVRCVQRSLLRPWKFVNVPDSVIKIESVTDREHWITTDTRWQGTKEDGEGGLYFSYKPHINHPRGGSLHLEVRILAKEPWRGYLSFMHAIGVESRGYGRGRLSVGKDGLWGMLRREIREFMALL